MRISCLIGQFGKSKTPSEGDFLSWLKPLGDSFNKRNLTPKSCNTWLISIEKYRWRDFFHNRKTAPKTLSTTE